MRILFLSRWYPYPADNGSRLRVFHLLRGLAARHTVHLVSFTSEPVSSERLNAMLAFCQAVEVVPYRHFEPRSLKALAGFFSLLPRSVEDTFSPEMQGRVAQAAETHRFDAVIASQIDMAPYAARLPIGVKVLEELELAALYGQAAQVPSGWHRARARLMWWKYARYVRHVLGHFSGYTVVSEQERIRAQATAPESGPAAIVPNGVDIAATTGDFGAPEADTLIYSGALTYRANYEAVDYFLREIFPLIRASCPNTRLTITGKLEGVPIERLPQLPGVVFTGYLLDIRPAVARSWLSIVPLRAGGGTRLKILESLALGTPVIATSKGAEGLDLISGRDLLIADTPRDFAEAVLQLLRDPALRETLRQNGRRAVAAQYDWGMIGQRLNDMIDKLMQTANGFG